MTDNATEIGFILTANDQTRAGLDAARKRVEDFGKNTEKHSEGARLAVWSLGEQFEELGTSVGIPFKASRKLGDYLADFSSRISPAAAISLGLIGGALAGGVLIWQHYADSQKKASEETLKAAEASGKWIESALGEASQTRELIQAKKDLQAAEFESNKVRIEQGIIAQTKVVEGLRKQYDEAVLLRDRLSGHDESGQSLLSSLLHGKRSSRNESVRDLGLKLDEASAKLKEFYAQQAQYSAQNKKYLSQNDTIWTDQNIKNGMREALEYRGMLDDAEIRSAAIDRANKEQQIQYEKDLKKAEDDYLQTEQNKITMLQGLGSVMGQVYEIGGRKMKAFYYMQQVAAAGEAFIQYQVAAAKAVGQGGAFGIPLATYFQTMSYVAPALILAKTFAGGGGGGGGSSPSVGTYSVNPNSGVPEGNGYRYFNYEQSKYGSGWRPGEGGQTIIVQGDVYAQDGDAFRKKVSSAVVRSAKNREYGVREAFA